MDLVIVFYIGEEYLKFRQNLTGVISWRLNLHKLPGFLMLQFALVFLVPSKSIVTIFIGNVCAIEESREMQYEHIVHALILYLSLCVWI